MDAPYGIVLGYLLCGHVLADFVLRPALPGPSEPGPGEPGPDAPGPGPGDVRRPPAAPGWGDRLRARLGAEATERTAALVHGLVHVVVMALVTLPILQDVGAWLIVLVAVAHMLVDAVRAEIVRRSRVRHPARWSGLASDDAVPPLQFQLFALDQVLHIATLALAAWAWSGAWEANDAPWLRLDGEVVETLGLVAGWIAVFGYNLQGASRTIDLFIRAYALGSPPAGAPSPSPDEVTPKLGMDAPEPPGPDFMRGRLIGMLERMVVVVLVAVQAWEGLALIVAAKSIARFEDLKKRHHAEIYLIGTLASVSLAILTTIGWIELQPGELSAWRSESPPIVVRVEGHGHPVRVTAPDVLRVRIEEGGENGEGGRGEGGGDEGPGPGPGPKPGPEPQPGPPPGPGPEPGPGPRPGPEPGPGPGPGPPPTPPPGPTVLDDEDIDRILDRLDEGRPLDPNQLLALATSLADLLAPIVDAGTEAGKSIVRDLLIESLESFLGGFAGESGKQLSQLLFEYWRDGKDVEVVEVAALEDPVVLFEHEEPGPRESGAEKAAILAAHLSKHRYDLVLLVGYADASGPAALNQLLSEQRARSVAALLRAEAPGADWTRRIVTYGAGERRPRGGDERDPEDRRVEILVLGPRGGGAS